MPYEECHDAQDEKEQLDEASESRVGLDAVEHEVVGIFEGESSNSCGGSGASTPRMRNASVGPVICWYS